MDLFKEIERLRKKLANISDSTSEAYKVYKSAIEIIERMIIEDSSR